MDRQYILFVIALRSEEQRLRPSLEQHYEVAVTSLRREALELIEEEPPDLVLVDVPSIRFDLARFFDSFSDLPEPVSTFLLLGKGMRLDQMSRANGYLRYPFSSQQLIRRLGRVIPSRSREIFEWRGLYLDIENRSLIWRGQQIPLTPKQADLILAFMASPNKVISREQLMKEVWGTDFMGDTRTLDVHIHWLRKALSQLGAPHAFETERGVGYRLISPLR